MDYLHLMKILINQSQFFDFQQYLDFPKHISFLLNTFSLVHIVQIYSQMNFYTMSRHPYNQLQCLLFQTHTVYLFYKLHNL